MSDDNVENSDSDSDKEDENLTESVPPSMKWYIEKDGKHAHTSRALKLLLPREYISKERSRRHWVARSLIQAWKQMDDSHDVIRFRDMLSRTKTRLSFCTFFQYNQRKEKNS